MGYTSELLKIDRQDHRRGLLRVAYDWIILRPITASAVSALAGAVLWGFGVGGAVGIASGVFIGCALREDD